MEPVEVARATDEVGVAGERHEERNLARRGSRPSRQRARRKSSRALWIASRPGPVELSAHRISSAACSETVPWRLTCLAAPSINVRNVAMSLGSNPEMVRTSVTRSMAWAGFGGSADVVLPDGFAIA